MAVVLSWVLRLMIQQNMYDDVLMTQLLGPAHPADRSLETPQKQPQRSHAAAAPVLACIECKLIILR